MGGGEIRTVEVLNRWFSWGVSIETIESHKSPSLIRGAQYAVNEVTPIFKGKSAWINLVNLINWILSSFCLLLKWKLLNHKFDVIVASTSNITDVIPAWLACTILRSPLVIYFHTTIYSRSFPKAFQWIRDEGNGIANSMFRALGVIATFWISKTATIYICPSSPVAEQLIKEGGGKDRVFITGNGIDIKQIESVIVDSSEKEFDVAFLGRIEEAKGVPDLLIAWRAIVDEKSRARLIVMGRGSYLQKARETVKTLRLKHNVEFTGHLSDSEKYAMMKSSRLFVFPTKAREGWGIVAAEAMACGLPVILYDNPVLVSVFGECKAAFFVQTGNIKCLIDKIHCLLADEQLLTKYSLEAKRFVRRFKWDKVAMRELEIVKLLEFVQVA